MDTFSYRDGELFAEGVALSRIAERFGTPTYVYSRAHIEAQYRAYADALAGMPHLVCFAVKANSNLGVLNVLARLGAGFDIVSRGELERVLAAGGDPAKVVFSGVGKTRDDMRRALEVGVHCFNVESGEELERLQRVAAELGVKAPVSLRVNPDVDAQTHPYISTGLKENKFGIAIDEAEAVYARAAELDHLEVIGVDCHIGSQLTQLEPFLDALERLLGLVDRLAGKGIGIRHLDLGGGLGVRAGRRLHPRHPRAPARPRPDPGVRAGPVHRRQRRRAADPCRVPQAHRAQGFRHRRRGDERPDPPGSLPGLDGRAGGTPARRRAATTWSGRSARPVTSSPRIATWRSPKATSWRCARPAPTASS